MSRTTFLTACFGSSVKFVTDYCQIFYNWKRSAYFLAFIFLGFIFVSSCKSKDNNTNLNIQKTIDHESDIPKGSPMGSLCIQALHGKSQYQVYTHLLKDNGLTSFLSNHPQFDFVFFVFPDSTLNMLSPGLRDSILSNQFNETKYKFFASHVSMATKGLPWVTGNNFNEIKLDLSNDNIINFNNKSVKLLGKLPSHERIQVFLISNPINS